tara:strand:+ start:262 stop:1857 length:1596 start_codon:yes stop_codon:yes gene_type:complete
MKIVELIIDENDELNGIEAISLVESPAIQEDFVALKDKEFKLAEIDKEQRLLVGALLVPNKPIYRKTKDQEYYIYFSRDTVKTASQKFLSAGNQNNATLEHQHTLKGLTLVESWIVEDKVHDKSKMYGMDLPLGTWVGAVKVNSDKVWNEFVKTGAVKGFSIEGYFADKFEKPQDKGVKDELSEIEEQEKQHIVEQLKAIITGEKITLQSYNDYPDAVSNNAQKGIDLNSKVENKCATQVGKVRASTLAKKGKVTLETIKRMYSFLSRAETYYNPDKPDTCGTISYLLWGGLAGKRWARKKLRDLNELQEDSITKIINDKIAIIDNRLAYSTVDAAMKASNDMGCNGFHIHELEGKKWYMPCEKHNMSVEEFKKYKCPKGYKKDYKQHKCVKAAKIGPRGGIRKSPKAPKGDTPNRNPKGKGTAKGNAGNTRSAKVTERDEKVLQKKADDFNERYKKKLGYGVTVGMLRAVYQRGMGAFNVSHSPRIKSATAWAQARVNAFLYLVKNGRPQNKNYTGDFDLLPSKHPKKPK